MNVIKKLIRNLKFKNPYSRFLSLYEYRKVSSTDRFEGGETKLFGNSIEYSDAIGFLHSVEEIFLDEVYDFSPETGSPLIVDCGSNIGLSIIYFKKKFPKAKIIGFEPDTKIFKILERNVKSFAFEDVEVYNAAVWKEDTELNFYAEGSLAGSTEVNYIRENKEEYRVKAIDLKKILHMNRVDFLKIDIEGAENVLMLDLDKSIDKIPFIFLEYHGLFDQPQQLGSILNMLSDSGFRYIIEPAAGKIKQPFYRKNKEGFENQLNIFCKKRQSNK